MPLFQYQRECCVRMIQINYPSFTISYVNPDIFDSIFINTIVYYSSRFLCETVTWC